MTATCPLPYAQTLPSRPNQGVPKSAPPNKGQVLGCLLGLALGDALGAPFEGGLKERILWHFIGTTRDGKRRTTDDTQMAIDVCRSLTFRGRVDSEDIALQLARGYRWHRGYGPGVAQCLRAVRRGVHYQDANRRCFSDGSYGNGAAVRSPIVGLYYSSQPARLTQAAEACAVVTHPHPLGIEGAVFIAQLTASVTERTRPITHWLGAANHCQRPEFVERLDVVTRWLLNAEQPGARQLVAALGNGIAATDSCVTAGYIALRFLDDDFMAMQDFVVQVGGDTDTIGAMAGALWGTRNGVDALPIDQLARLEGVNRLFCIGDQLHQKLSGSAESVES